MNCFLAWFRWTRPRSGFDWSRRDVFIDDTWIHNASTEPAEDLYTRVLEQLRLRPSRPVPNWATERTEVYPNTDPLLTRGAEHRADGGQR